MTNTSSSARQDAPQGTGAPSGTGSRASHEASSESSPKASIPSAANDREIIELYTRGVPVAEIVKRIRCATAKIYSVLRENRVPLRFGRLDRPRPAPEAGARISPDWSDLNTKSVDQINAFMGACARLMEIYADNLANAEERFRKEREFLAMLVAEYERMAQHVAARSTDALNVASAIEARRAATECGAQHESAVGAAEAPNSNQHSQDRDGSD